MGPGGRTITGGDWAGYGETRHDKHEEVRQLHVEGWMHGWMISLTRILVDG